MTRTVIFTFGVLLILAWYLSFLAGRLDRLHHRVETSWEHLDALLQRRAAIALEISHSESLDPATGMLLTAAAYQAREANIIERNDAETSLSQTLKLIGNESGTGISEKLLEELKRVSEKISLAVTIHLEAVNSARALRDKLIFRIFRLAGHAPLPVRYAFEDDII
jgi:hypothetical protein